jgi:hypothetical protein
MSCEVSNAVACHRLMTTNAEDKTKNAERMRNELTLERIALIDDE